MAKEKVEKGKCVACSTVITESNEGVGKLCKKCVKKEE